MELPDKIKGIVPHSSKILIGIIILICIIIFAVGMNTPTSETASYKVSLSVTAIIIAATGVTIFLTSKFLDTFKFDKLPSLTDLPPPPKVSPVQATPIPLPVSPELPLTKDLPPPIEASLAGASQ